MITGVSGCPEGSFFKCIDRFLPRHRFYKLYVLYQSAIARSASFRIEESGKSASVSGGLNVAEEITPFFSRSILSGTGLDAAKRASVAFFQNGINFSTLLVLYCSIYII